MKTDRGTGCAGDAVRVGRGERRACQRAASGGGVYAALPSSAFFSSASSSANCGAPT